MPATMTGSVLAFVPAGRSGSRVRDAASSIAKARRSWLTIAVPVGCSIWLDLARAGGIAPDDDELRRQARLQLAGHIDAIDQPRVHGILVGAPLVCSLLRRIESAQHELLVVPAGWEHFAMRLRLAARARVRVVCG